VRIPETGREYERTVGHDGVPWNNNNAENAIKQFAYYREETSGIMKEGGLSSYLTLLSLYQTCRYKGISFLKFLVSGQRDVDAFCMGNRSRRRRSDIQVYPKGFIPPHFPKRDKQKATDQSEKPDGEALG
jgi:hypothetical protein